VQVNKTHNKRSKSISQQTDIKDEQFTQNNSNSSRTECWITHADGKQRLNFIFYLISRIFQTQILTQMLRTASPTDLAQSPKGSIWIERPKSNNLHLVADVQNMTHCHQIKRHKSR